MPVKVTSDMRSEVGGFPDRAQEPGQWGPEPRARGRMDIICRWWQEGLGVHVVWHPGHSPQRALAQQQAENHKEKLSFKSPLVNIPDHSACTSGSFIGLAVRTAQQGSG